MLRPFSIAFLFFALVACSATDPADPSPAVATDAPTGSGEVDRGVEHGEPDGRRPALGFMPAYESDEPGVTVEMVTEGSPADKAGLQAGDRIVEMGGEKLLDIQDYVAVLSSLRVGASVKVKIMRSGKAKVLNVGVGER